MSVHCLFEVYTTETRNRTWSAVWPFELLSSTIDVSSLCITTLSARYKAGEVCILASELLLEVSYYATTIRSFFNSDVTLKIG